MKQLQRLRYNLLLKNVCIVLTFFHWFLGKMYTNTCDVEPNIQRKFEQLLNLSQVSCRKMCKLSLWCVRIFEKLTQQTLTFEWLSFYTTHRPPQLETRNSLLTVNFMIFFSNEEGGIPLNFIISDILIFILTCIHRCKVIRQNEYIVSSTVICNL